MKVSFSYLSRQFNRPESKDIYKESYTDSIFKELKRFVATGDFTLGRKLEEFEEKFAHFIGVRQAVGVSSGTDALILTLRALGVGRGDEVITCAETFIATAGAIAATGASPVFVDVNDEFTIDASLIEKSVTKKTKAIIPVWFTGNAPDMKEILAQARKHKLLVIEDSCCAIDAAIAKKKAGSFGDAGTFSFHPLKNLNVWSDAGMITTDSHRLAGKLRLLRNHGLSGRDKVKIFGFNSRMDTLQAVVALCMFKDVKRITDMRIANARILDREFSKIAELQIPKRHKLIRHVFHLYMVRAKNRDGLLKFCHKKGIEAKVHYPIPLPYQKCCKHLGYKRGDFPKTERDCGSIITFPAHQCLRPEELEFMIHAVKEFYGA